MSWTLSLFSRQSDVLVFVTTNVVGTQIHYFGSCALRPVYTGRFSLR